MAGKLFGSELTCFLETNNKFTPPVHCRQIIETILAAEGLLIID